MKEKLVNLVNQLGNFCFSNLENGNTELILNCLGERYLSLIIKKQTNTEEFVALYNFFKSVNLIPIINKQGDLSFIEEEKFKENKINIKDNSKDNKEDFFKKRFSVDVNLTKRNSKDFSTVYCFVIPSLLKEKELINDIFWNLEEELNNILK